jgi:ribosomal protein S18 acetylase RimI-like enzyme
VEEVSRVERARLLPILEESFEGLYLWHARRTLQSIGVVLAAMTGDGEDVGLVMLKLLARGAGYVYYVAVMPRFRRQGIGGRLLDEALSRLASLGVVDVYASVEEENAESKALFASRGFVRLRGSEMYERYGRIRALLMYREMTVVPGEVVLGKRLEASELE